VARRSGSVTRASDATVAGVRITHPDKLMFPGLGLTKLDIAKYYESVADRMLPHLKGRPLTLVFCPAGVGEGCTYLRHTKVWGPRAIRRVKIQEKTKVGEYMVVDTLEGLVSLAQMNVLEIHTWNSTIDRVEQPDRIVLDLDPGERVTWPQVVAAAKEVRKLLATAGLKAWLKTTGGRGLHIVVPLAPSRDWSECLEFSRAIAAVMVEHDPASYTTDFRKAGRESKILIDYLRNNRTNTSICAFSVRARAGAPVSMPIAWTDLKPSLKAERFTLTSTPAFLKRRSLDPWRDYARSKQRLKLPA
jgi:bifunctional non-homologous end joining protein LigD